MRVLVWARTSAVSFTFKAILDILMQPFEVFNSTAATNLLEDLICE